MGTGCSQNKGAYKCVDPTQPSHEYKLIHHPCIMIRKDDVLRNQWKGTLLCHSSLFMDFFGLLP